MIAWLMTNALEAWNVNLNLKMNQGCWLLSQQVHLILTTKYSDMLILLITYVTTHFTKEIWECNITNYAQFQFFKTTLLHQNSSNTKLGIFRKQVSALQYDLKQEQVKWVNTVI